MFTSWFALLISIFIDTHPLIMIKLTEKEAAQMQRGHVPEQERHSRKKLRRYTYVPATLTRRRQRLGIMVLLCCVMVFSAWQLISYGVDYFAAQNASDELRELYHEETEEPTASPTPTEAPTPTPTLPPEATSIPTATPATKLDAMRYPGNPYNAISTTFQKLRRQNADIVAWLNIPGLLDEAVVQRDNSYYLKRDYKGYHNVNGAIFLDEGTDLSTRPYTLLVFGHNMKTGAMFGCLRNYETLSFYQKNPFISFNTMYEDGQYVIFSIAQLSLNPKDANYFSFGQLNTNNIAWRQEAIESLISRSAFYTSLDVQPEDQLLLLVTCVEDDEERRVVAARRLRDGETTEEVQHIINRAKKW